jgi:tetratricopeptide (TPR) repeat protein
MKPSASTAFFSWAMLLAFQLIGQALTLMPFPAIGQLPDPISAARKINDARTDAEKISLTIKLVIQRLDSGLFNDAAVLALAALDVAERAGDRSDSLHALRGEAFFYLGLYSKSRDSFKSALVNANDSLTRAMYNLTIAYTYDLQGEFDQAVASLSRATKLLGRSNPENEWLRASIDNSFGLIQTHRGAYDLARESLGKATAYFQSISDTVELCRRLEDLANIELKEYYAEGKNSPTSGFVQKADSIISYATLTANPLKDRFGLELRNNLRLTQAEIEVEKNDLVAARQSLDMVKTYGISNLPPDRLMSYNIIEAKYLFRQGDYLRSKQIFQLAIDSANSSVEKFDASKQGMFWYVLQTTPREASEYMKSLTKQFADDQYLETEKAMRQYEKLRQQLELVEPKQATPDWPTYAGFLLGTFFMLIVVVYLTRNVGNIIMLRGVLTLLIGILVASGLFYLYNNRDTSGDNVISFFGQEIRSKSVGLILIFMAVAAAMGMLRSFNKKERQVDSSQRQMTPVLVANSSPAQIPVTGNIEARSQLERLIAEYMNQLTVEDDPEKRTSIEYNLQEARNQLAHLDSNRQSEPNAIVDRPAET